MLLDSLAAQHCQDFTLILGDQNADARLQELIGEHPISSKVIYVKLTPLSLSAARNYLLPYAEGEIVAFTDDDCTYFSDTLKVAAEFFEKHPGAGALIGKMVTNPKDIPAPASPKKVCSRYGLFRDAPSVTLFIRKECTERIGGFNEGLGIGSNTPFQSGEETDYIIRCFAQGCKFFRVPEVRVYHPAMDIEKPGYLERVKSYGLGRMRLLKMHGFPVWFRLVNLLYPLGKLFLSLPNLNLKTIRYWWAMFIGRLQGLFAKS